MHTGDSRHLQAAALLAGSFLFICNPAGAAQPCAGVDTDLTDARKAEYAALVAKSLNAKVKPSAVGVSRYMGSGAWSAVYASTPVADDGVLFFEVADGKKQFKDVWGGVADPSERQDLIKWAKDLGAPVNLAKCFAHVVVD